MALSIQDAIDTIIASVPGAPLAETVDTVKTGDASQPLQVAAVTFTASYLAITQAIQLGANLLITHEPTFYNHFDSTDLISSDPVYLAKKALIEKHNLVIWRFHDYFHSITPDHTVLGLIEQLGWQPSATGQPYCCNIPSQTLRELTQHVQTHLGSTVRVVGNLDMTCQKVAIAPGFPGLEIQLETLKGADVLIAGEINEWEISEYVRDAAAINHPKGLIVIGHQVSEEAGIRRIVPWLCDRLPGVEIHFIPNQNAFHYL